MTFKVLFLPRTPRNLNIRFSISVEKISFDSKTQKKVVDLRLSIKFSFENKFVTSLLRNIAFPLLESRSCRMFLRLQGRGVKLPFHLRPARTSLINCDEVESDSQVQVTIVINIVIESRENLKLFFVIYAVRSAIESQGQRQSQTIRALNKRDEKNTQRICGALSMNPVRLAIQTFIADDLERRSSDELRKFTENETYSSRFTCV